jgi:hypothetical protein
VRAGEVIGAAWAMYKAHWRHLLPIALVVYILISLLGLLLALLLGLLGAVIAGMVSLAGVFWVQGALVLAIEDVRDGRADLSIQDTLSRLRPRLNTLALAGILAALAVTIGLALLIVPGLFLLTIWLLIVPAIMLERAGVLGSFGRSRELVRGHGWSVFGVIVLTILVLIGVGIVFSIVGAAFEGAWVELFLNIASQTVTAPFVALAWTMTYYRLRDLKEPAAAPEPPLQTAA